MGFLSPGFAFDAARPRRDPPTVVNNNTAQLVEWHGETTTGSGASLVWNDSSGNGSANDAIVNTGTPTVGTTPSGNLSIVLDGSSDMQAGVTFHDATNDFVCFGAFKVDPTAALGARIFDKGADVLLQLASSGAHPGELTWTAGGANTPVTLSGGWDIRDGLWHSYLVHASFNNKLATMYIDGNFIVSKVWNFLSSGGAGLFLGGSGGANRLKGQIASIGFIIFDGPTPPVFPASALGDLIDFVKSLVVQ